MVKLEVFLENGDPGKKKAIKLLFGSFKVVDSSSGLPQTVNGCIRFMTDLEYTTHVHAL